MKELKVKQRRGGVGESGGAEEDEEGQGRLIDDILLSHKTVTDADFFNKIAKKQIDLESLAFAQNYHLMSNEEFKFPQNSTRVQKKGYDEIYIPSVKHDQKSIAPVRVSEMPQWAQSAFLSANIDKLNYIQSAVYRQAFSTPENMLICAPTGAGKTNIALLAMLQTIGNYRKSDGSIDKHKFKIIYIAPMKALVNELVGNLSRRLKDYHLVVRELTGDMQLTKQQIDETQVIVATPEKWDIVTRKAGDRTYTELVRLLIIDEIHLLHDLRGPVLEAIIARTIRMIETTQEMIRIVALSATLPNYSDVGSLIRVRKSEGLFYFDQSFRPVPLEQQFIGISEKKAVRKMMLMNEILYEKITERIQKYQIIVFVHSRKETVKTANIIKDMAYAKDELARFVRPDHETVINNILESQKVNSADLKELLMSGFGIHHAGLSRSDRDLVEDLFSNGNVSVLVTTSTLAWGVNLPAHTVIIKGTQIYSPEQGKWVELSPQDILQMMGRAGRPQYDKKGEGIIITTYAELKYYLSLMNQQLPIESQFVSQLADQLNAEIVLGSVTNLKDAVNWLGYTYLYIRMLRNPQLYGIAAEEFKGDPLLVHRRTNLAHSAAILLDRHSLIKYDKKIGTFQVTALGKIASHYYIRYPSIQVYNENLKTTSGLIELLKTFSLSNEFKLLPIREEEKGELAKLMEKVPVPIKGSPDDTATKINILLQSYIGRIMMEGFALNADMVYVQQSAGRIMRAIFEICLKRQWAAVAETALTICKMIDKRMWSCMTILRQFKGIPEEILKRIERKEQFTFEHLYNLSAQQLGELVKVPKIGKILHKFIHQFPKLEVQPYLQPITRSCLKIDLTITPDFQWEDKVHGTAEPFWIFVTDCNGDELLYCEYFQLKQKYIGTPDLVFSFTVPLFENLHPLYFVKVISDRWLQSETVIPISFKNLILPEKFQAPTELFDYKLHSLSTLDWPQGEMVLDALAVKQFNQIQTQTFKKFYQSSENVFLGAPNGSGKTLCALLALLRLFREELAARAAATAHDDDGAPPPRFAAKAIYVAPYAAIVRQKLKIFQKLAALGIRVGVLTGQKLLDKQIVDDNDLILAVPEYWDTFSSRWKSKKVFAQIRLFIIDELHLLNENNAIIEVITSRMRYISAKLKNQIQLIGLAASVATYREVAQWIGAAPGNTFNFHPNSRPNPLDIHINGFDQNDRKSRVLAMQKQLFNNIKYMSSKQQIIVYVSDRKQAKLTALDLLTLASADAGSKRFLHCTPEQLKRATTHTTDYSLLHTLESGIGFIYEGMEEGERADVEGLYRSGAIQILVSTYTLCWDVDLHAFVVIILDCLRYNGQEKRYVDYSIPDLLQMIGHARSNVDKVASKCLVFCHAPKKDYYKKMLNEPYPVESSLQNYLNDHICAEIVAKNIVQPQDCIDWITWTFMYWRLPQNPNYYNLQEVSGTSINDYLSGIVEATLEELQNMKCIVQEEKESELIPINLGIIASYYYINTSTIDLFNQNIKEDSKIKHLLEVLANATEYENIQIRHGEDPMLKALTKYLTYEIEKANFNEPSTKTNILLQCHFSRVQLAPDFVYDQQFVLEHAIKLVHGMVDIISSNCWLSQTIKAMQLCQMIVQALWANQSPLLQIPHFTPALLQELKAMHVEDIGDFLNLEDTQREEILKHFTKNQVDDIVRACNRYPSIQMNYRLAAKSLVVGEPISIEIDLEREGDPEDYQEFVYAPYLGRQKEEVWWILVGERKSNKLYSIKRISIRDKYNFSLQIETTAPGDIQLSIYLICDSYIGCDHVRPPHPPFRTESRPQINYRKHISHHYAPTPRLASPTHRPKRQPSK